MRKRSEFIRLIFSVLLICTHSSLSAQNVLESGVERKPFPPPQNAFVKVEPEFDDFLGSDACAGCHKEQYDLWRNSTHGRAGGPPSSRMVIGDFSGEALQFKNASVTPIVKNDRYYFVVEQEGFSPKTFTVDAVVGGGHLEGGGTQTYFSKFPDGTLRFLPFDFIRKENLWFGETKHAKGWVPIGKDLSITDLSEWPPSRILGTAPNFNNCQECHGSQIQVSHDIEQKRCMTRYKSLDINCESCHGPGKRHVELAKSSRINDYKDIGMKALATLSKDESLKVCFQCHALKDVLQPGYLPGKDLADYYAVKFPILGQNPYHPDGRIRAFGYQQNHLYSDCYLNGSMTCVDCHDPHSQSYRDINGKKLEGKFDNGQCTACHASKGEEAEKHSHHKPDSPGNLCTSCHMPYLQHKAMGKLLRFARSDHTISIPRPEFDDHLGIENACKKCHQEISITQLQTRTNEWYGVIKPHKPMVTNLIKAQKIQDRIEAANLLLNDSANHPMAQVAGLSLFIQKYLRPNMANLEPEIVEKLKDLSEVTDVDLRALALMSLHLTRDNHPLVHGYLMSRVQSLGNDETTIRKRWAIGLAYLGGVYRDKGELGNSLLTYEKALEIMPGDPALLSNLGLAFAQKGDFQSAIKVYMKALDVQPVNSMVWLNLGIAYRNSGEIDSSFNSYKKAVELNPSNALAYFNLGNHFFRANDLKSAVAHYTMAVEIDPSIAGGHFNLARTYLKAKQLRNAVRSLRAGLQYAPEDQGARQMLKDLEASLSNL